MAKLRIPATTYRRKGTLVHRKSYLTPDKGKRGRTPESERWSPEEWTHTGWSKDMPTSERREIALRGHRGDLLATARGLQRLANLTRDRETKRLARVDARYFYREYRRG